MLYILKKNSHSITAPFPKKYLEHWMTQNNKIEKKGMRKDK